MFVSMPATGIGAVIEAFPRRKPKPPGPFAGRLGMSTIRNRGTAGLESALPRAGRLALFTEQLGGHEDQKGPAEAAARKQINERITGGRKKKRFHDGAPYRLEKTTDVFMTSIRISCAQASDFRVCKNAYQKHRLWAPVRI